MNPHHNDDVMPPPGTHEDNVGDESEDTQPRGSYPLVDLYSGDGTPIRKYGSWIVREIITRVRIADDFPFSFVMGSS